MTIAAREKRSMFLILMGNSSDVNSSSSTTVDLTLSKKHFRNCRSLTLQYDADPVTERFCAFDIHWVTADCVLQKFEFFAQNAGANYFASGLQKLHVIRQERDYVFASQIGK